MVVNLIRSDDIFIYLLLLYPDYGRSAIGAERTILFPSNICSSRYFFRDIYMYKYTRSSACVPAVAGTHAPGRGEGVVGLRRWLEHIITAVSSCRG